MTRRPLAARRAARAGLLVVLGLALAVGVDARQRDRAPTATYVLSDTHMGLGRVDGVWDPREDFRWPVALSRFLDAISATHPRGVDLVIAGDFLELWQPPPDIDCSPPAGRKDFACSVAEAAELVRRVVGAHAAEMAALARFARRPGNCLHVVPGNHDAALLEPAAWAPLHDALRAGGGCVRLATEGRWTSADRAVVVEHGHQIGRDPNRIEEWPEVAVDLELPAIDSVDPPSGLEARFLRRPWGEAFVQSIFNAEELEMPLLDNLSPSSAGARYRLSELGLAERAREAARFLLFNLRETSLRQKAQGLGEGEGGSDPEAGVGRALGWRLAAASLDPGDPLRQRLEAGGEEVVALRSELDGAVRALSDEEILSLCDLAEAASGGEPCLAAESELGASFQRLLFSRSRVTAGHVEQAWERERRMRVFVYGHTHSFELPWETEPRPGRVVEVANSGAFQRLLDDARLLRMVEERRARGEDLEPVDLLRALELEDLPACYTVVEIEHGPGVPDLRVRAWWSPEDGPGGRFVSPCDPLCPNVGHGCD